MTADATATPAPAPPSVEAQPAQGLAELVAAALDHPDRWFSAVARSYVAPDPEPVEVDAALAARLEAQVAAGDYTSPEVATEEVSAPGPHGPMRLRVYRPDSPAGARPLLVWCHGGGFLGGDLDMPEADATAREVCVRAGAVVVSVDYRLAVGGVHFPVPHDDVLAAYEWALAHTDALGTTSPPAIGGASAGANLAAGAALRLRDEQRAPASVLLLYPLVHPVLPAPDHALAATLSGLPNGHAFRSSTTRAVIENYLGGPVDTATPYAFAALGNLRGYPPTLVINCEYDGLRASGEAFTEALREAGVAVTQLLARDVLHGHINSPWLPQAQQSYADMATWLTR